MRDLTTCLLTLFLGASLVSGDEPAHLTGSVTLAAAATVSPYADLVVSAHPLAFAPTVGPQAEPAQIEQREVAFAPRVVAITKGTAVQFINRDKIFHNVFTLTEGAKFDIGRRKTGVVVEETIEVEGEIDLFCDIHPQMNATILSLDTPYFVAVDANGRFAMPSLPPGRYEIRVYHPDINGPTRTVELTAGDSTVVDFSLGN
jgi:plastocyanin